MLNDYNFNPMRAWFLFSSQENPYSHINDKSVMFAKLYNVFIRKYKFMGFA